MANFIKNTFDSLRPTFSEGGKLSALHSVFEGMESFFLVPNDGAQKHGVQIHDAVDSKRTMIMVVIALIPALLFGMYNVGYQHFLATGQEVGFWMTFFFGALAVIPYILASYITGLGIEFTVAQWKHEEIQEGFLVTGFIIPLIIPINTPIWMVVIATAFAVIFAKEVFGGTGYNFVNVALVARAFLFFAYPTHMTGDNAFVRTAGTWGWDGGHTLADAYTGATPLGQVATNTGDFAGIHDVLGNQLGILDAFNGLYPGSVGETCVWAIALGGLLLLLTGVASWKTMLSVFVGGGLTAYLFNLGGSNAAAQMPWYLHLLTGGFCFGAVFMATDPVTSARTECGKYIYGLLIGMVAIVTRVLNPGYPEGMMLAILFGNCMAPLIDWCIVQVNVNKRMKRATAK